MATPATLKKLDDKKMAAQKRREKLEADQLLPLNTIANAPSAHLLVSGNPNPAPRMMDIRGPMGQKNSSKFAQYRQPQQMGGMGVGGAVYEDFAADQPQQHHFTPYMSFSAFDQQQRQHQSPQQYHQESIQNQPMNPNMLTTFSQIQIGPMPMKPLSAWNNVAVVPQNAMMGAGGQIRYRRRPPRAGGQLPSPKLRPQTVVDAPASVESVQYVVRANNLVCFHGREHFLSTLYPCNIYIDGHTYPSIEHYYQACKIFQLAGAEQAQMMRAVKDPLQAKSKARELLRSFGIPNQEVEKWKNAQGLIVLFHGIRHKFNQDPDLRDKLLNTGDALLCQAYNRDSMFAIGMNEAEMRQWAKENEGKTLTLPAELTEEKVKYLPMMGKGKNVLGVICMQVRKAIRDKEAKNASPADDQQGEEEEKEVENAQEEAEQSTQSEEEEEWDEEEGGETEQDEDYGKEMSQQLSTMLAIGPSSAAEMGVGMMDGNGNQFGQFQQLQGSNNNKENNNDGEKKETKKAKKV